MQTKEETLFSFLNDASSLATTYSDVLDEYTLHIYESMLSPSQLDSRIAAHFSKKMTSVVRVGQGGTKSRPMWLKVF